MPPRRWLNKKEAAEELGCSIRTIERRIEAGEFVTKRDGRRVLISSASLEAYLHSLPSAN